MVEQRLDVVYALAASPCFEQDGVCYAARSSGLYCSRDGGRTWNSAYERLATSAPLTTMSIALSPDFGLDHQVFAGVQGGVLRSADGGANWQLGALPSPPPVVTSLVVSPQIAADNTLLAGTLEDGVFRSADRGTHWAAWNFGLLDQRVLCLALSPCFGQDETIFAGTETGLFCSTNGGRAWRVVELPADPVPVLSLALSPNYGTDGGVWAGTESHGLYRSCDRGHTWARLGQNVVEGDVNSVVPDAEYDITGDILIAVENSLLISHDKGLSWSGWPGGSILSADISCIAAPQGIGAGAPLLVGFAVGSVLRLPSER